MPPLYGLEPGLSKALCGKNPYFCWRNWAVKTNGTSRKAAGVYHRSPDSFDAHPLGYCPEVRQNGYTITMRYFLPMIRPSLGDAEDQYHYDIHLDLEKMPKGLTAGEYAFAVVRSMSIRRSVEQYNQKTDIYPELKWTTLTEHLQTYGKANGWNVDDPELAVEAMLERGADIQNFWDADLVEWPFSGDRCFLAWCEKVVDNQMRRHTKTKNQREQPEANGSACSQLGRWVFQRPELMASLPDVLQRLAKYVETVDSMSSHAFETFTQKHHSNEVMHCEGISVRAAKVNPVFQRALSKVLRESRDMDWSEQAFRSFALGFAWAMRASGNPTIFDKVSKTLNRAHQWMSPAQLSLCMNDQSWVAEKMNGAVEEASPSVVELAGKLQDHGMQVFYPTKLGWQEQKDQHKKVTEIAQGNPQWAYAMYKLSLASTLREHFGNQYGHTQQSFERIQEAEPLLRAMVPGQRDALFEEMTQAISAVAKTNRLSNYKTENPWGMYADAFFDAWAMQHHEEEVEARTALGIFMEWLQSWNHPYEQDLKMLGAIAGDAASVGNWLAETVANVQLARESQMNLQNDPQILLHELLDFSMESESQKDPQNNTQNWPQVAGGDITKSIQKAEIPPKQDFAVTHPHDYWNVGGLF